MPLLTICGRPGSGKTTRANEIAKYIHEVHKRHVQIINEESLSICKNDGYKDPVNEKMTRGFIKSNVEKHISQDTVVIVDSMNYIKGYRYELYCLARSAKTTNCTLYLNTSYEKCKEWNSIGKSNFDDILFEDLYKRLEIPKQKDRWDSPYFEVRQNEQTPLNEIADVLLYQDKQSKNPTATKIIQTADSDFVQISEKKLQEVVDVIIKQQNECFQNSTPIRFLGTQELINANRILSLFELKKLKQEFQNLIRINNINKLEHVFSGFICFINSQLNRQ